MCRNHILQLTRKTLTR